MIHFIDIVSIVEFEAYHFVIDCNLLFNRRKEENHDRAGFVFLRAYIANGTILTLM